MKNYYLVFVGKKTVCSKNTLCSVLEHCSNSVAGMFGLWKNYFLQNTFFHRRFSSPELSSKLILKDQISQAYMFSIQSENDVLTMFLERSKFSHVLSFVLNLAQF